MKANNILNRILAELSSIREVKFEQMTLENGAVLEAESFEAGNEVFVISGEDRVAAPIGEHLLADGRVLVITEEGVIAEIKEATAEAEVEVEVEAEAATELADMPMAEEAPAVVAIIEKVLEEIAMMREEMKGMREEMGRNAKEQARKWTIQNGWHLWRDAYATLGMVAPTVSTTALSTSPV